MLFYFSFSFPFPSKLITLQNYCHIHMWCRSWRSLHFEWQCNDIGSFNSLFFFPLQQEDMLAGWLIVGTYQPIYSAMLTLLDTSYCQLRDASNIFHFAWRLEFSRNILKDGSCCSQFKAIFILLIWVLHI